MMDDADERERAEAAALAAALDGRDGAQPAPDDALQAALLVRHSGARGELSAERADAVLERVLGAAKGAEAAPVAGEGGSAASPPRRAVGLRLLPWGAGLAAAAALGLLLVRPLLEPAAETATEEQAAPAARAEANARSAVPRVDPRLLSAQSALITQALAATSGAGGPGGHAGAQAAEARFDRALRVYRAQLFRALSAAYPQRVGMLEPSLRATRAARWTREAR